MKKFCSSEKAGAQAGPDTGLRLLRAGAMCLFCLLFFAQCDIWNKPLVSTIEDKIDELKSIKTIWVTKYPYPNTFMPGDDAPYKMSAQEWADSYGLEISGVNSLNEMRVLAPGTEYLVEMPENNGAYGSHTVTVILVDKNIYDGVTTKFDITVSRPNEGGYTDSYTIARYDGVQGSAIPFPSTSAAGQKVSVYVYPKQGFILKKDGLAYKMSSPPANTGAVRVPISGNDFDMPAYDIALEAGFEDVGVAEAMRIDGNQNLYYKSLEDAVYDAGTTGVVYILAENVFLDKKIRLEGTYGITLMAQSGPPKTIQRKAASTGAAFLDSLFELVNGASLTLDAGYNPSFVLDGGLPSGTRAGGALVTLFGGSLTMGARVTLQNNDKSNGSGGGVCIYSGLFSMNGGLIQKNSALTGGGVYVYDGEFSMKDGIIKENTSVATGSGVYNNSVFNISGNALVTQDNDVYLADGKYIRVSGSLTPLGGLSAKITPQTPSGSNTIVLHGITQGDTTKFTVGVPGKMIVLDGGGQGKVVDIAASRGYAAGTIYYPSLQEAVNAAAGTASMPDTITVLKNIELASAISGIDGAGKNIRLTVPDGTSHTIKRGAGFSDSLFNITNGASFTLEGSAGGVLTIDGGANWNNASGPAFGAVNTGLSATKAMIFVNGGTLTIKTGTALQNNHNIKAGLDSMSPDNGGGVYVTKGAVFMEGGEISANKTAPDNGEGCLGGGIFLYDNSYFLMTGNAKVSGNFAKWGGGVGLKNSRFVMQGNAEISGNAVSFNYNGGGGAGVNLDENAVFTMKDGEIKLNSTGSGIRIHKGTFNMEGGVISGNTSDFGGGGVSISSAGGTFTKTGGVVYGSNAANMLENITIPGKPGHAVYAADSTSKKRDATAWENDNMDSAKPGTAGGWD
ncbi:MAG: hypothetical protein LBB47_06345 [Spirochaetaceae bacterium]|nr:hypothetical protein [Spirochaetaceae bacterium]